MRGMPQTPAVWAASRAGGTATRQYVFSVSFRIAGWHGHALLRGRAWSGGGASTVTQRRVAVPPAMRKALPSRVAGVIGFLLAAVLLAGCGGKAADQWLRELWSSGTTEGQIAQVESPKADERREALDALAAKNEARGIPSVVKIFCIVARSDKDTMVRDAAVRGLAQMQGEGVLEALSDVVANDRSDYVRREAVLSLARRVPPEGATAMIQALKSDASPDVRLAAAEHLRRFRDKAAAETLAAVLQDTDVAVALRAWESLRYMTGQDLPRQTTPWAEFLASGDDPFTGYGKPPPLPRGENQRPQFTRGPRELIRDMFKPDVREGELK